MISLGGWGLEVSFVLRVDCCDCVHWASLGRMKRGITRIKPRTVKNAGRVRSGVGILGFGWSGRLKRGRKGSFQGW